MAEPENQRESKAEAARKHDDATRGFAETGTMRPAADGAKRTRGGPGGELPRQAEGGRSQGQHPKPKR